jgi:hypothetical protein
VTFALFPSIAKYRIFATELFHLLDTKVLQHNSAPFGDQSSELPDRSECRDNGVHLLQLAIALVGLAYMEPSGLPSKK